MFENSWQLDVSALRVRYYIWVQDIVDKCELLAGVADTDCDEVITRFATTESSCRSFRAPLSVPLLVNIVIFITCQKDETQQGEL